jgi:hypothetical protein
LEVEGFGVVKVNMEEDSTPTIVHSNMASGDQFNGIIEAQGLRGATITMMTLEDTIIGGVVKILM